MEDHTDSGYETDSPKPVDSVVCDVHEVDDIEEDEIKEKLHVDSFLVSLINWLDARTHIPL